MPCRAVLCWLTIGILPAFAILDRWVAPAHAPAILALRAACVALLLIALALSCHPVGRRHPFVLMLAVALVAGVTITVISLFSGGGSPRAAGFHLLLVGGALFAPWRPIWSALVGAMLVGGFAAFMVTTGNISDLPLFVSNVCFLTGTALVGVAATAFRQRLRWREFLHRAALERALEQRSEFLAKMSHELRTPLHVIIGYTDVMLDDLIPPAAGDLRDLTRHVRAQGMQLNRLISDLLDYSKAQAGKLEVRCEPVHLGELAERVSDGFQPLCTRSALTLDVALDPNVPVVLSDAMRLEQILLNLVSNAIKFTTAGGVQIEARRVGRDDAELDELTVLSDDPDAERARPDTGVVILVRDTGIGIHSEDLQRLAVDFEQIEGPSRPASGTGLGLSICRRFAKLLGGCIAVASTQGRGSVFAVFLPAPVEQVRAAA